MQCSLITRLNNYLVMEVYSLFHFLMVEPFNRTVRCDRALHTSAVANFSGHAPAVSDTVILPASALDEI